GANDKLNRAEEQKQDKQERERIREQNKQWPDAPLRIYGDCPHGDKSKSACGARAKSFTCHARRLVRGEIHRPSEQSALMNIQLDRAMSAHARITSKLGRYAAVPLRLIVGYGFMTHGYAKIVHGPEHFINILHALGVPAPELMGWASILVELIGGLAVLV